MSAAATIAPPADELISMPAGPSITDTLAVAASTAPTAPSKRPSRAGTSSGSRSTGGSTSAAANGYRVEPSFRGILDSTYDALLLFEGSRRGVVPRIKRRLTEEQRDELIQSGSIFIFEEEESGIKRWTDGLIWSPSRILGNYLVYRQTEQRNSRGPRSGSTSKVAARKKAAAKAPPTPPSPTSEGRKKYSTPAAPADMREPLVRPPAGLGRKSFSSTPVGLDPASLLGLSTAPGTEGGGGGHLQQYFPVRPARRRKDDNLMEESDEEDTRDLEELIRIKERSLVGSLTNSYAFKEGGLVKRTMSLLIGGKTQHLVSYYTLAAGMTDQLRTPSMMPEFANMEIDPELLAKAQFRFPPVVETGLDGVLRYVSEADSTQSPDPESPEPLPKAVAPPVPVPTSAHRYYAPPSGLLSSSYPAAGMAGHPLVDSSYSSSLHFPAYSMQLVSDGSMIAYGAASYSTYSAPDAAPHHWSSSLPKEFHHPAVLASPFPHYQPLPPPPAPQQRPLATHRSNSISTTAKTGGPGPQRRRRASQTSTTASTLVPEGRQPALTGSPFGQPNRPLAGGKPGFHPYAMPSPTEGWQAYHPSSARSPQHTGSSTRSSYFDGEPSVFAAGPLSSAVASTPSSAGSSLSAGSGGGAILQQQQQQHASSTLTPAMHTTALGPPGGSASKRLSLSIGRDKNYNSPHRRRSPSMQPSPLRSSAPLPLYGGEVDPYTRSAFPHHAAVMPQYGAQAAYSTLSPRELPGGEPTFNTSWMTAPHEQSSASTLHQPYTEYYDAPPEANPQSNPLGTHYGPRSSPPQSSVPFYSGPSSLLLNPPMTTFAEDKRSATLALDQLHFGSIGGAPDDLASASGGREYQIPSGMVAADDRGTSFGDYTLQPLPQSPEHIEQPGPRYWAA